MRQSISPNKANPDSYYEALNKRVIVDNKSGSIALTDEPGTKLLLTIPETRPVYTVELDLEESSIDATLSFYTDSGSISVYFNNSSDINTVYSKLLEDVSLQLLINSNKLYYGLRGNKIIFVYLNDTSGGLTLAGDGLIITTVVPTQTEMSIIATASLRDWLILFTRSGIYGQIWKCNYSIDGTISINSADNLVYNNVMYPDLSANYEIYDVVGRYDNDNLGKIYWSNSIDNINHLNILDKNSLVLPIELLSITPDCSLNQPKIVDVTSGGLYYAGMVQYGYQLYNLNGAETVISPLSGLVHLTESNSNLTYTLDYKGTENGEQAGKAVSIKVENIDKKFEFIKIIAVFYTSEEGEPEVNVVYEGNIPHSGTLNVVDAGDTVLSVYTPAQLNSIGTKIFSPKLLTTKDNFLIAGNITDKYFDVDEELGYYWDARTYRFGPNSGGLGSTAKIKYVGGSDEFVNNEFTLPFSVPVPETHDCYLSKEDQDIFKYKVGGTVLGGSGPKISYGFRLQPIQIDVTTNTGKYIITDKVSSNRQKWGTPGTPDFIESGYSDNNSFSNYASPINQAEIVGYQRNEIYRVGIVFFDDKGRQSFVKWVGDIKMPVVNDTETSITHYQNQVAGTSPAYTYDIYFRCQGDGSTYANVLGLDFKFNFTDIPSTWKAAIVRARREDIDKTIVSQGTITPGLWNSYKEAVQNIPDYLMYTMEAYDNLASIHKSARGILFYYSPEHKFNKTINKTSTDIIKVVSSVESNRLQNDYPDAPGNYWRSYKFPSADYGSTGISKGVTDIVQAGIGADSVYTLDVGSTTTRVTNFVWYDAAGNDVNDWSDPFVYSGSCVILGLEDNDYLSLGDNVIVNYERTLLSQYGGFNYISKQNTSYILAGKLRNCAVDRGSVVFGGDTFIELFDFLHTMHTQGNKYVSSDWYNFRHKSSVYVPVETTINLALRHDTCTSKDVFASDNPKLNETIQQGFIEWPKGNPDGAYPSNLTDLYLYNRVYSKQPTGKIYVGKPFNFRLVEYKDCEVVSSERFIQGELIDSWTRFLFNNKLTVNSNNGALSKLHVFRNQVMFWQDKAFGLFSFNDRKLITDPNGTQLILGVGSVLEYFQYISEMSGTKFTRSVVDSGAALYYYDDTNHKLMMTQGGAEESISDIADCSPLFKRSEFDNPIDVIGVFDKTTRRVLIVAKESATPTGITIGFNERLQAFESTYSFVPNIITSHDGRLIAVSYTEPNKVYEHNDESIPNRFYGSAPAEGYISIVAGDDEDKLFTNVEFNSVSKNATTEYPLVTVNNMQLENSYTASSKLPLIQNSNLRRRFRSWRIQLPRDNEGVRYLDSYLKLTLFNTPTNNSNLRLEDIIIYYLIPIL